MAMSNGTLGILMLSAAIATFAIRSQSQAPPTASQMSQQTSYSSRPGTPKWNRAAPDSSFQAVTAAQQEDGNPNAGQTVGMYPTNVRAQQPGMPQPSSVAPQDWPPNQVQADDQNQNLDDTQDYADMPSADDAAMADQAATQIQRPNVTLNLDNNPQAANPYEFTDQEMMDRMMATMPSRDRDSFAMVWLLMSPEEQNNFIRQFRNQN